MTELAIALVVTVLGHKALSLWGDNRTRRWADVDDAAARIGLQADEIQEVADRLDELGGRLEAIESAWELKREMGG